MFVRAVQYVVVCKMNACAYHARLLYCHVFGDNIEHNNVLVRQPRAQNGPEHMYCSLTILCIIQDYAHHDD